MPSIAARLDESWGARPAKRVKTVAAARALTPASKPTLPPPPPAAAPIHGAPQDPAPSAPVPPFATNPGGAPSLPAGFFDKAEGASPDPVVARGAEADAAVATFLGQAEGAAVTERAEAADGADAAADAALMREEVEGLETAVRFGALRDRREDLAAKRGGGAGALKKPDEGKPGLERRGRAPPSPEEEEDDDDAYDASELDVPLDNG